MNWNADLYDQKHAFVYQFGENVVELLDVKPGERIHDVGCGTGYLTQQIKNQGADVIGTDYSPEMIAQAQKLFPEIKFAVADAGDFHFDEPFDAVFSNAALHWVKNQDGMMQSVYNSLKTGGRFVAEMGGKGNVQKLIAATKAILEKYGYHERATISQWYFPSLGEYASRLESHGFRVVFASHFDRKTPLQDGDQGVSKWIEMFGSVYFEGIPDNDKKHMLAEITEILRPDYEENGQWYADYKRLRFIAVRE
ncbi:methyltransferase domain-containing protein [Mucilaginibacter sp. KACC 22063]|uniref:methyltransferase domain-containing protein n=1 Tax=Mucilaginibacter sp. KACC 22063 TaxID=3025666 RepID=UPI002365B769|nr:methyltransferase domain-containing protein [Mucilaginibacter sp. KACC 22063]WDF56513.1 methyltransferase domain-containing protein [Mucilaginibacter sp. KACC 22063]